MSKHWPSNVGYGIPPTIGFPSYCCNSEKREEPQKECDIARWEELFNQQNAKIDALKTQQDDESEENKLNVQNVIALNTKLVTLLIETKQKECK